MSDLKPQVVFFGSGPVAAESLRLLLEHCEVEAVITKPSTEREMGAASPDTPLFTVSTKKELDVLIKKGKFESKLGILIDFGIIVSQYVIDSFEKGIINSHFSLLPEWRGADPISFSILSGQKQTGVSLMMIEVKMDTGVILTQKTLDISSNETAPELTDRLILLSDKLLEENLPKYFKDEIKPKSQPHPDRATYSRKLTKEDGILDFTKPAEQLEREIRAFMEWPKSRTEIAGKDVVILKASVNTSLLGSAGKVFKTDDKKIGIYTSAGALIIEELKPAGKQAMSAEGFLAGYGKQIN